MATGGGHVRRLRSGGSHALGRLRADAWPLLQRTAAATVAWVIARQLIASGLVIDHDPFFAPIAAVIALNASLGERGLNALRLLLGVVVGIVVGEVTVAVLGSGHGPLAIATFTAMAMASALGGARILIAQAAVGAILTVTAADGQAGAHRLIDALIGAGVALVVSQILFSPEPVSLVRRAQVTALEGMAEGLRLTARALEHDDDELAERALSRLRELRDRLAELSRMRRASSRVVRHTLVWRSRKVPVVRENENAGHLDLLGGSCLMLTRTTMAASPSERRRLAPSVRDLAGALSGLAQQPGDRPTRQRAVDHALDVARQLAGEGTPCESTLAAAIMTVRLVAADIMVFAGVDPRQALDAVREGTGELRAAALPPSPRTPFTRRRRRQRR
jgi:uncharacterized membrane protein YgaE (UPF0421/DUF939 family)